MLIYNNNNNTACIGMQQFRQRYASVGDVLLQRKLPIAYPGVSPMHANRYLLKLKKRRI